MPVQKLFSSITLVLLLAAARGADGGGKPALQPEIHLRRPVAVVADGDRLYVANRDSGTLSVVSLIAKAVIDETLVGNRLSDLAAVPGGDRLLVLDEGRHRLLLLDSLDSGPQVVQRLEVPHSPVQIDVSVDGSVCAVSSLWARRLTLIDINPGQPADGKVVPVLAIRKRIDLPFAPRALRFIDRDKRLIVADAFGGRLAAIDVASGKLISGPTVSGHNIRGLAVAHGGRELHVTHQLLDGNSTTTHDHVFWGGVMKNFVRSIPLDDLLSPHNRSESVDGSIYPLGHPSGATGDPGSMLVTKKGEAALLLSGVDEIALRRRPREPFVRRDVGRRPTALCASPDEETLYVVNTFDDSISVIDLSTLKLTATISLGPQPALKPAERGEQLFYDARLSLDGWFSCHSCHTDGHTNGLLNDNFGDDYFGDPKQVPSLLGVGRTHPWGWNGKTGSLDEQIVKSITVTMQGEKPSERTVRDLASYLKTLKPPPGLAAARGTVDRGSLAAGRLVFRQRGCVDCHASPTLTTGATYDVGLKDKSGNKQFNPPSLLGISQRGAYFHDGRAKSLRDVVIKHQHNLERPLSDEERQALLMFLRSL